MPRKREVKRRTEADLREVALLRPAIERIVRQHDANWSSGRGLLSGQDIEELTNSLLDEVGFATAGLRGIVRGKHAKPDAWNLDIFVDGIRRAFNALGLSSSMAPRADESRIQHLAKEVAAAAGFPVKGELFHQMQRARQITREKLPDIEIRVTVLFDNAPNQGVKRE